MHCRVLENCEGGAAVAALQKRWLTNINWIFGTAGIFSTGGCSGELHCCISGRGDTGGKRKKGKSAEKILGSKYTIEVGFTGDSIIWTRQQIYISSTHLVSITDTTGCGVVIVRASTYSFRELHSLYRQTVGAGVP